MTSQESKIPADLSLKELSAADLQKRAGLIKELNNTEENYIEDLKIIIEVSSTPDLINFTYFFVNHFRLSTLICLLYIY